MGHSQRGAAVGTADAIEACEVKRFNASGRLTWSANQGAPNRKHSLCNSRDLILSRSAYSLLEHFNGFPQSLQSCFFFLGVGNPAAVFLAVGIT